MTNKRSLAQKKQAAERKNRKARIGSIISGLLVICLGVIFMLYTPQYNPISRDEAIAYSGELQSYDTHRNYYSISFRDGTCYEIYPHTEPPHFLILWSRFPRAPCFIFW